MNAAVRAVVRTAVPSGVEIFGIFQGYSGMVQGHFEPLELSSVANIIQRGGTFLKSGRSKEFVQQEGRARAAEQLKKHAIDGLVAVGGDGTFRGAHLLYVEHGISAVGIPGTIDNDIFGTDFTIGYDTAVNTALDAIDRIRDTAASHDRLFIVEVMGRESGFIAIDVGLGGGAEEIFIPENHVSVEQAVDHIKRGMARGKTSSILVAAEGQSPGRAYDLADQIRRKTGFDAKVCVLGHVQRGGSPTAQDRILASRLGHAAVTTLLGGGRDIMIGVRGGQIVTVPFEEATTKKKRVPEELIELAQLLSR